jgi:WD40 repeat protein
VSSVAFASDGSRIVIGGKEETRVWDVASGSMVLILRSIEPVSSVAFSVDGTQIVTGGEFGFVRTWPQFSVPELITRARASNLRPLNQDDRRRFGLLERPDGPG